MIYGYTAIIQNNLFTGNQATSGGGMLTLNGNSTIQNNTFAFNIATYGGGIFADGDPTIQNNTIAGNQASAYGGGIMNGSGNPTIQNNTISGNHASIYGGGISIFVSPTIRSNIVVSNTAPAGGGISYNGSTGSPLLDYNDVWNNPGGNYSGVTPGVHDISNDPRLVDPVNGDFHLLAGSPCIDAGDPINYPATDFEGDPRPIGPAPDIGVDEYRSLGAI